MSDNRPEFGGGLIVNRAERTQQGKINSYGVITVFWSWAYPCTRKWEIILPIFDVPRGKTSIMVSLKKYKSRTSHSLEVFDITAEGKKTNISVNRKYNFRFTESGRYNLICSFKENRGEIKIPFDVIKRAWPEFTKEEKDFISNNPNVVRKARAIIECGECGNSYTFEERILKKDKVSSGTLEFPNSGEFECEDCGNILQLKDIQGQVRQGLKDQIRELIPNN